MNLSPSFARSGATFLKPILINKLGAVASSLWLLTVFAPSRPAQAAPLSDQALAERYAQCWNFFNKRAWPEFEGCYDKAATSVAPGMPKAKGGKDIVEKHSKPFAEAMPDVTGDVQLFLVNGRNALSLVVVHGTHTGPLKGPMGTIPPTNKKFGQVVVHAIESSATAAAAHEWFIQDGGTFMAQLGLMQRPARAALTKGWNDQPKVVVGDNGKTEKANLASLKRLYDLFNKQDKAQVDSFADDIVMHEQTLPADLQGKAAGAAFLEGLAKMSSNRKVKPSKIFTAGDYTVAIGEFTGKNDGEAPAFGIPQKTNKSFTLAFIEVARWENGKIKELWPFIDGTELAGQLGLMPAPTKTAQK